MRKYLPSEKVYSTIDRRYRYLLRMKIEPQATQEKYLNLNENLPEAILISGKYHKIICVSDIFRYLQCMSHILIQLVQIDIPEYLRSEIAEWDATKRYLRIKTMDYSSGKVEYIFISYMFFEYRKKYTMINTREKSPDIAFQDITRSCKIVTHPSRYLPESIDRSMGSFSDTRGVGVSDES
jgi:hypothetical protein